MHEQKIQRFLNSVFYEKAREVKGRNQLPRMNWIQAFGKENVKSKII